MHDLGISMADVFEIASLNGARLLGLEAEVGSIEVGKRAHLILFEANPLIDSANLLDGKTVIKDGVMWTGDDHEFVVGER